MTQSFTWPTDDRARASILKRERRKEGGRSSSPFNPFESDLARAHARSSVKNETANSRRDSIDTTANSIFETFLSHLYIAPSRTARASQEATSRFSIDPSETRNNSDGNNCILIFTKSKFARGILQLLFKSVRVSIAMSMINVLFRLSQKSHRP